MKVHIIYESHFNNGKRCAEYLKNAINKKGHDVILNSIIEVQPYALPKVDMYIFSTPTHTKGPPKLTKDFLSNLRFKQKGIKYALITTHMNPKIDTLKIMEKILTDKGLIKISEGLEIKVMTMKGPLEDNFQKKLDEFIRRIFPS